MLVKLLCWFRFRVLYRKWIETINFLLSSSIGRYVEAACGSSTSEGISELIPSPGVGRRLVIHTVTGYASSLSDHPLFLCFQSGEYQRWEAPVKPHSFKNYDFSFGTYGCPLGINEPFVLRKTGELGSQHVCVTYSTEVTL